MSVASLLQYRHLRDTALEFVSTSSATDTAPQFVAGSNILTSYKGYFERRPGFPTSGFESSPTTFTAPRRTFAWRRWGGQFYIMLCDVKATTSVVYKLAVGVDASFVSIFTSNSTEPFDFVVSNNFLFFGNGLDMKKWDGTTVTKWGIGAPSIGNTGACSPVSGVSTGTGPAWTNPGNITVQDGANATNSIGGNVLGAHQTDHQEFTAALTGFNFAGGAPGFSIPTGDTILGILVEVYANITEAGGTLNTAVNFIQAYLAKAGIGVGNINQVAIFPGVAAQYYPLGGSTDLWGSTWTPADVNGATFGTTAVGSALWNNITSSNLTESTISWNVDHIRVTIYYSGSVAPSTSTSGTGITAATGWQYVYCYYNSTTGHVSSPSAASVSTGAVTNKTVNVTVTASTDPQVDKIRIFRTTDGGGGQYFEITQSPVANASAAYPDTTPDVSLSTVTAPTGGFNDPPPNSRGFVWFANRIWMFKDNKVYATDWEEQNIGVPEESCVSGPAGNFWSYDAEVTGLSVASDGVIIFLAGAVRKIDGDSLDTFRRTTISIGIGCRERATICRLGNVTAFLANTNSIWMTDSASMREISKYVQSTIDGIDHSKASMSFHVQGQNRWLILLDRGHQQSLVYDIEKQYWMPPWSVYGYSLHSGETSEGSWNLMMGHSSGKMLTMSPTTYTDNAVAYSASVVTNLWPMVPEHQADPESSQTLDAIYPQQPGKRAYMQYVGLETNTIQPDTVSVMTDDAPNAGTYIDITATAKDPELRKPGTALIEKWYYARGPGAKRVSLGFTWAAAATNFNCYNITMAYRDVS